MRLRARVLGPSLALGLAAIPAQAQAPAATRLTSSFESAWGASISRDCGFMRQLPNGTPNAFWLFCDTAVFDITGRLAAFHVGTTAAIAPFAAGLVPTDLTELPTPPTAPLAAPNDRGPARFLPQPDGLTRSDGTPCTAPAYPASWASGTARIPFTNRFLITYTNVCVQSAWSFVLAGQGVVEYVPVTNTLGTPTTLFSAAPGASLVDQRQLGSPVFGGDGYVYMFAKTCDAMVLGACAAGQIYLARVPSRSHGDPGAYEWRTASAGWARDPAMAGSVVDGATPSDVTVDSYKALGRGYAMVETTSVGGTYRVWNAPHPAGPWTQGGSGTVDGCTSSSGDLCRALIGHPELSTPTGLSISYYRAADAHIAVTTVPW